MTQELTEELLVMIEDKDSFKRTIKSHGISVKYRSYSKTSAYITYLIAKSDINFLILCGDALKRENDYDFLGDWSKQALGLI